MTDCFQDVAAFLNNSRKAKFSLKAAELKGGISFVNVVKKVLPLMLPSKVVLKEEGRLTTVGGRIVLCSHAKEDKHAILAAEFSGSKAGAFIECSAVGCGRLLLCEALTYETFSS